MIVLFPKNVTLRLILVLITIFLFSLYCQDKSIVSCNENDQEEYWSVKLDQKTEKFFITIENCPTNQGDILARKLRFLITCAAVQLLHSGHGKKEKSHPDDLRFSQVINWSLECVGKQSLVPPPKKVFGTSERIITGAVTQEYIPIKKKICRLLQEILLLSWSYQTQELLNSYLQLIHLEKLLNNQQDLTTENFTLKIKNLTENRVSIQFSVPFKKLLMDNQPFHLYQLHETYYSEVSQSSRKCGIISEITQRFYPYPYVFSPQNSAIENISDILYSDILQFSLWEQRVKTYSESVNKFWIVILCPLREIANVKGNIDDLFMNAISNNIQKQLESYFLVPIQIRKVSWKELKNKKQGILEKEQNYNNLGKEEVPGLLRFVERSMMAQFTEENTWYSGFTFVMDNNFLDYCPPDSWIYMKSYRKTNARVLGEFFKIKLFKKSSSTFVPYDSSEYQVKTAIDNHGKVQISVTGITAFQNWFSPRPLDINLYYENTEGEHKLADDTQASPVIVDIEPDLNSILLFEISGYRLSVNEVQKIISNKRISISVPYNDGNYLRKFDFQSGSIISSYVLVP